MQKWVLTYLLNWLLGKAQELFSFLYAEWKKRKEAKEIKDKNESQADKVQAIADEIQRLVNAGLPVPQTLKDQLLHESRNLSDGTFDADRHK